MTTAERQLKLDKARWYILRASPFYGALAMTLSDVVTSEAGPTACTNGKIIRWNPDFLDELTEAETRFVLLHETLHCANGHFWRLPIKERLGQMAGDYAINAILGSSNLQITMPKGGLRSSCFDNMAEEQILAALRARQQTEELEKSAQGETGQSTPDDNGQVGQAQSGNQSDDKSQPQKPGHKSAKDAESKDNAKEAESKDNDCNGAKAEVPDPGQCGSFDLPDCEDSGSSSAEAVQELREEWERRLVNITQSCVAAGIGNLPEEFARKVAQLCAPASLDWRQELADFVKTAAEGRPDWSRSGRRHAWQPVIYPRQLRDKVGLLVVGRDNSGSVDSATFELFSATLGGLIQALHCEVILLDFDAEIAAERRVLPGDIVPDGQGGGGTDFRPVFARVAELQAQGEMLGGLVMLTDLEGPEPKPSEVSFPVLWVCTTKNVSKVGRTVPIRVESCQ